MPETIPNLNVEIYRNLERCRKSLNLAPEEMKILDFGCGEGRSVLALRKKGYDAVGIDVRAHIVASGQEALRSEGYDGQNILFVTNPGQPLPFEDQTFDFVFSHEVLEHVDDLSFASRELFRVTKPGGIGFHIYRPQFNIIEPHFSMPLVHWLPKNNLRKGAILFFSYLGIGMKPLNLPHDATQKERGEFLYQYSVNETFYRPYRLIGEQFHDGGFEVYFAATGHRKLESNRLLSWLCTRSPLSKLAEWTLMTFFTAYLLTMRPVNHAGAIRSACIVILFLFLVSVM